VSQWYDRWIAGSPKARWSRDDPRLPRRAGVHDRRPGRRGANPRGRASRQDPDVRVELQPIDPRMPAWLARIRGVRTIARMPLLLRRAHPARAACRRGARLHGRVLALHADDDAGDPDRRACFGRPVILNYRDGRAPTTSATAGALDAAAAQRCSSFRPASCARFSGGSASKAEVVHNVVDTDRFRFRRSARRCGRCCSRPAARDELYAVENTILAFEKVRAVPGGAAHRRRGRRPASPRSRRSWRSAGSRASSSWAACRTTRWRSGSIAAEVSSTRPRSTTCRTA
jgi:hypothetical protein